MTVMISETQKFTENITKPATNDHENIKAATVFVEGLSNIVIFISLDNISRLPFGAIMTSAQRIKD